MPRKKNVVRRFKSPLPVSREMVEHEARYVAKEVDDYLLLSLNELRRLLEERRAALRLASDALELKLRVLPDHELAAVQAMLVRDTYHLAELYLAHVRTRVASGEVPTTVAPPRVEIQLPFSEWLFGSPE